jgi:hypothetical protein
MKSACADLIHALKSPDAMRALTLRQWDRIIPQSRAAGLLGRVGALADQHGLITDLPVSVRHELEAGLTLASRQAVAVHYELGQLDKALAGLGEPVLVLKGAAYVASGSAAAAGRMMSDIDILVRKPAIPHTEAALMLAGWASSQHDVYDQRYYREWMHEIPPMQHIKRETVLDVHHNLLPETARIKTFPEKIIAAASPLPGMRCLHVPSDLDLILHSATHLMHEGEWEHGLRDLVDIHALVATTASQNAEFWTDLSNRSRELNLERPLYYTIEHLRRVFGLEIAGLNLSQPNWLTNLMTNALLARGFASYHSSCHKSFTTVAVFILYMRSHWLRMPSHLLIPHLLHKALQRETTEGDEG